MFQTKVIELDRYSDVGQRRKGRIKDSSKVLSWCNEKDLNRNGKK